MVGKRNRSTEGANGSRRVQVKNMYWREVRGVRISTFDGGNWKEKER